MNGRKEFYRKLKKQLVETTEFPSNYLYKFIVPANTNREQQVAELFNEVGAVINTKRSKTGKYVSVSVELEVDSADSVIDYYQKAEKIEDIISL